MNFFLVSETWFLVHIDSQNEGRVSCEISNTIIIFDFIVTINSLYRVCDKTNCCYPHKQELYFFEKNVFAKIIFSKFQKNNSAHKKFVKYFFLIFSKKTFPKKHFFFKKQKFLLIGVTNLFSPEQQLFFSKTKCPQNCAFFKNSLFLFFP